MFLQLIDIHISNFILKISPLTLSEMGQYIEPVHDTTCQIIIVQILCIGIFRLDKFSTFNLNMHLNKHFLEDILSFQSSCDNLCISAWFIQVDNGYSILHMFYWIRVRCVPFYSIDVVFQNIFNNSTAVWHCFA